MKVNFYSISLAFYLGGIFALAVKSSGKIQECSNEPTSSIFWLQIMFFVFLPAFLGYMSKGDK